MNQISWVFEFYNQKVKEKHKFYSDKIITGGFVLSPTLFKEHQDCINEANEIKNVLENAEKEGAKFDKDD